MSHFQCLHCGMVGSRSLVTIEHVVAAGIFCSDLKAKSRMELRQKQIVEPNCTAASFYFPECIKVNRCLHSPSDRNRGASPMRFERRFDAASRQCGQLMRELIVENRHTGRSRELGPFPHCGIS
jgi:hypothetical protein